MSWFTSTDEVPVELEDCRCPGSPHDHDTVWLRPELTPDGGIAAMQIINGGNYTDVETVTGLIGRTFLQHGISRWTFVDDQGEPVPVTHYYIARLKWETAAPIAERANDLYADALMRPLLARLKKSSRNGRTARSTSPRRTTSTARPKRSRPSTTVITPLHPEPSTSSAGDSSTSPRKKSA